MKKYIALALIIGIIGAIGGICILEQNKNINPTEQSTPFPIIYFKEIN